VVPDGLHVEDGEGEEAGFVVRYTRFGASETFTKVLSSESSEQPEASSPGCALISTRGRVGVSSAAMDNAARTVAT
jgi:hypothetical protein